MGKQRIDVIDISSYQKADRIVWSEVKKAGVQAVIHKASEGTGWTDDDYATRRKEAKAAGLVWGAYHFAHPAPGNAKAEAQHFLRTANLSRADRDLGPILDLETNEHRMSPDALTQWVTDWFNYVFSAIGVRRGILYTHYTLTKKPAPGVLLWASRYSNSNMAPVIPRPFNDWAMWQFTDGTYGNPSVTPGAGRVDASTIHKRWPWARLSKLQLPAPAKPRRSPTTAPVAPVARPVAPSPKTPRKAAETPVARLLRLAGAQVGYHEGRSNGHWNNIQKFSPAVKGLEWSQGQPWCATFVSWVAQEAGLAAEFPCTASVAAAEAWWKGRGQWSEYPAIGAQVIFGNGMHTGIVENYDDTYVYTIEGNTNTNGSAEGDGVYRKKRLRRDPYVTGYGYPHVPGGLKSADPNYSRSK